MHLGTQQRPPSRIAMRILLLLALLAASMTLTHCRMVGDRVTGASIDLLRRKNECTALCQDQYKARNQAENQINAQNITACAGITACLTAEAARHLAAVNASKALRDACLAACEHQQGSGSVGP